MQYWVRWLLRTYYDATVDGLPGNDDCKSACYSHYNDLVLVLTIYFVVTVFFCYSPIFNIMISAESVFVYICLF